jgi:hypothetical protein
VRAERLEDPTDYIGPILDRVKADYIQRRYEIPTWTDHHDFLSKLAIKNGRLGKGGEPDLKSVAVNVINDWQRGKLPYFVPPPKLDDEDDEQEGGEEEEAAGVDGLNEGLLEDGGDDDSDEEKEELEEVTNTHTCIVLYCIILYGCVTVTHGLRRPSTIHVDLGVVCDVSVVVSNRNESPMTSSSRHTDVVQYGTCMV